MKWLLMGLIVGINIGLSLSCSSHDIESIWPPFINNKPDSADSTTTTTTRLDINSHSPAMMPSIRDPCYPGIEYPLPPSLNPKELQRKAQILSRQISPLETNLEPSDDHLVGDYNVANQWVDY